MSGSVDSQTVRDHLVALRETTDLLFQSLQAEKQGHTAQRAQSERSKQHPSSTRVIVLQLLFTA